MPNIASDTSSSNQVPRRVGVMVTYLYPFRMVESADLSAWSVSIEQINRGQWDYAKLHEIAGGIDVGLSAPYHMVVGRDGALALPVVPELRSDQKAVEFFNRCLAALLLGGVYCEAIRLDNLEFGSIIDWKFIRTVGGQGEANRLHTLLRMRMASAFEAIMLLEPPTVHFERLQAAARDGFALLQLVQPVSPEFLLKGVSGIARRDWGLGLSNLWITIEQLTEALWQRHQVDLHSPEQIPGRRDQLRDARTWTAANRQELLFSKGVISAAALRDLYAARKARNELLHRGAHPDEHAAQAAYRAALTLMKSLVGEREIPLSALDLSNHSLSDPFKPVQPRRLDPKWWMEIPKLPGEAELEREEAKARK